MCLQKGVGPAPGPGLHRQAGAQEGVPPGRGPAGGWLVVERAYPLGKWDLHRKGKRPAPEAIEGDRNPYLAEGRGQKAQEARPEPQPEPEPKPEPKPEPRPEPEAKPKPKEARPRRDTVRVWRAPEEPAVHRREPGGGGVGPRGPQGLVQAGAEGVEALRHRGRARR
jgi:hypothetical protein